MSKIPLVLFKKRQLGGRIVLVGLLLVGLVQQLFKEPLSC